MVLGTHTVRQRVSRSRHVGEPELLGRDDVVDRELVLRADRAGQVHPQPPGLLRRQGGEMPLRTCASARPTRWRRSNPASPGPGGTDGEE